MDAAHTQREGLYRFVNTGRKELFGVILGAITTTISDFFPVEYQLKCHWKATPMITAATVLDPSSRRGHWEICHNLTLSKRDKCRGCDTRKWCIPEATTCNIVIKLLINKYKETYIKQGEATIQLLLLYTVIIIEFLCTRSIFPYRVCKWVFCKKTQKNYLQTTKQQNGRRCVLK